MRIEFKEKYGRNLLDKFYTLDLDDSTSKALYLCGNIARLQRIRPGDILEKGSYSRFNYYKLISESVSSNKNFLTENNWIKIPHITIEMKGAFNWTYSVIIKYFALMKENETCGGEPIVTAIGYDEEENIVLFDVEITEDGDNLWGTYIESEN